MKRVIVSILLSVFLCTGVSAESLVWKAEKDNSVMYLGGTVHALRESDYPLPSEFDKAYKASEIVVLETNIGKLKDLSTQQKLLEKAMYADGSTIDKHLSSATYEELSAYCASNGIPLQALSGLKPSMLVATLTVMELMKLGATQHGVDEFFYKEAEKDKKVIKGLEDVDDQINYLTSMGDGDEDEFVTHAIRDLKTIRRKFEILAEAWRKGDSGKLEELMNVELRDKEPKLYKKLVTDRNNEWMILIEDYQTTPETEFILVGSAHLVGHDGIIEALKKKGYKVDKL
ncbi:MAG: TraB/GumN family protein [Nitrospirales bacterium]|nr:TraB/GumN family protein [Nitrospirales bacterium]